MHESVFNRQIVCSKTVLSVFVRPVTESSPFRKGRSDDGDGMRTSKEATGTKYNEQHAFLYISLPFSRDYYEKIPNFMFYGGRKQATTKASSSFWT